MHDKWKLHVKKYLVGFLDAMASDGTSIWNSTFGYMSRISQKISLMVNITTWLFFIHFGFFCSSGTLVWKFFKNEEKLFLKNIAFNPFSLASLAYTRNLSNSGTCFNTSYGAATKTVMSFTPFYTIMVQVWGNNSRFYCPRDK